MSFTVDRHGTDFVPWAFSVRPIENVIGRGSQALGLKLSPTETEREVIVSQEAVGLVINGTMGVAPEDREKFAALVRHNVAQTVGVPGCIHYAFAADVRNPNLFHNVEAWTDRAALEAHMQSKVMQEAFAEVRKLRLTSRDVTAFTVSGSFKL